METFFGKGKTQMSLWYIHKFVFLALAHVLSYYLNGDVFGPGVMWGQGWRGLTLGCWMALGTLEELGTGGHFAQRQFLTKSFHWSGACTPLFIRHYFQNIILKLIQSIHFQIHLLHSFCLLAWSQSSKDLIYPSEKGKKRLISFWSAISKEYANVSKLVFVTFSFNTHILLQVTNNYIKNSGNDHHITAVTGMLASGHQGLISTKVVLPFQKYKGS